MPDYKNEPAGIEQLLPWNNYMKEHSIGTDREKNKGRNYFQAASTYGSRIILE